MGIMDIDPDEKIVSTVDNWEKEQQRTQREAERMRHRRRVRVIWSVFGVLVLAMLGGAAWVVVPMWQEHKAAKAAAAADRHEAQDQAWQACVNAIGLEKCNLIEERLAERCLELDSGGRSKCLKAEIEER